MGKLEQQSKKRSKRKNLQNVILATVATVGFLTVALIAPNVISAMGKLGLIPNKRQKEYISSSASKMTKKGLLKFNGRFYELTQAGREQLGKWELTNFKFKEPKKWDKKWRVVIFDIPEKKRKIRNGLTELFRRAGIKRLQNSVWIYPYDCEDIIALLKTHFGIGKDLLYMIVAELENDKYLRKEFGLIR